MGLTLRQRLYISLKTIGVFAVHQKIDECPSLRVKHVGLERLVVIRRVRINGEKGLQRKRRIGLEQLQPLHGKRPERNLILPNIRRCEILGQTFVEPRRPMDERAAEKVMGEFVIDDTRQCFWENPPGKDDEITILATLVIACDSDLPAVVLRSQLFHRLIVSDQQDFDRKLRKLGGSKYQCPDELMKSFQLSENTPPALFPRRRFNDIGVGADLDPGKEKG